MNVFQVFTEHVRSAVTTLAKAGVFPSPPDLSRIVVEPPREASHGDLATNAAMALAKDAGLKQRELAEKIAAELRKLSEVTNTEIAGPGFINLTLDPAVWRMALAAIVREGADYGRGSGNWHPQGHRARAGTRGRRHRAEQRHQPPRASARAGTPAPHATRRCLRIDVVVVPQ